MLKSEILLLGLMHSRSKKVENIYIYFPFSLSFLFILSGSAVVEGLWEASSGGGRLATEAQLA